jgi:hypothetical protein
MAPSLRARRHGQQVWRRRRLNGSGDERGIERSARSTLQFVVLTDGLLLQIDQLHARLGLSALGLEQCGQVDGSRGVRLLRKRGILIGQGDHPLLVVLDALHAGGQVDPRGAHFAPRLLPDAIGLDAADLQLGLRLGDDGTVVIERLGGDGDGGEQTRPAGEVLLIADARADVGDLTEFGQFELMLRGVEHRPGRGHIQAKQRAGLHESIFREIVLRKAQVDQDIVGLPLRGMVGAADGSSRVRLAVSSAAWRERSAS